jgi:glycine cleavage system aminomethyltransferase T
VIVGAGIDPETDSYEAGLGWAVRLKKGDFIGRDALLAKKKETAGARSRLHDAGRPGERGPGQEPILAEGRPAGYVTSAAYGYTIGRQIACGYLPAALTTVGSAVEIEYLARRLRAMVASEPLLDPAMARLKA